MLETAVSLNFHKHQTFWIETGKHSDFNFSNWERTQSLMFGMEGETMTEIVPFNLHNLKQCLPYFNVTTYAYQQRHKCNARHIMQMIFFLGKSFD